MEREEEGEVMGLEENRKKNSCGESVRRGRGGVGNASYTSYFHLVLKWWKFGIMGAKRMILMEKLMYWVANYAIYILPKKNYAIYINIRCEREGGRWCHPLTKLHIWYVFPLKCVFLLHYSMQ